MRPITLLLSLLTLLVANSATAGSYSEEMSKAVKKAFGPRISGLSEAQQHSLIWLTYPTDNFGVVTTSIVRTPNADGRNATFLCAPSTCLGRPPAPCTDSLNLYGFASIGAGAPVQVNEKAQKDIAIAALGSGIAGILGIDLGFTKKKDTTLTLMIGKAYVRLLERPQYEAYIRALPEADPRKVGLKECRLVINDADIVVEGLAFGIEINTATNVGLTAQMDSLANLSAINGGSISLRVAKAGSGSYLIKTSSPLVVAVAPFQQHTKGSLELTTSYTWEAARLPKWAASRNTLPRLKAP